MLTESLNLLGTKINLQYIGGGFNLFIFLIEIQPCLV